jgi:hypothetical protein
MSNYIIDISGNKPYYVQVSGSTSDQIYNLSVSEPPNVKVDIFTDFVQQQSLNNNYLQNQICDLVTNCSPLNLPSGYPINNTSGLLPYTRISGLSSYVYSVSSNVALIVATQLFSEIDGGSP